MRYIKWALALVFWVLVIAVFHYTLPQHDVARITDTYEKRIDFGENSLFWASADVGNAATSTNRDVFFIQTKSPEDRVMVYRNEDTGWGWPPYFKFDTSNLQAEAADLKSGAGSGDSGAFLESSGWGRCPRLGAAEPPPEYFRNDERAMLRSGLCPSDQRGHRSRGRPSSRRSAARRSGKSP